MRGILHDSLFLRGCNINDAIVEAAQYEIMTSQIQQLISCWMCWEIVAKMKHSPDTIPDDPSSTDTGHDTQHKKQSTNIYS